MFDVGFSEVLLIAVVALLVLGPERLPKAARFAGLWIRRARGQWDAVRNELERELAAEELKASVERARREAAAVAQGIQTAGASVQHQAKALETELATLPSDSDPGNPATPTADPAVLPDRPLSAADGHAASSASGAPVAEGQSFSLEAPLPTDRPAVDDTAAASTARTS